MLHRWEVTLDTSARQHPPGMRSTEGWAAVATAINQRQAELGLSQRELIERSNLSKAVVHEIRNNVAQRRRSARTLEALSVALAWHPQHLVAVLEGRRPRQIGEPATSDHDLPGRLAFIESRLYEILDRLDDIAAANNRFDQLSADMSAILRRIDRRS